MTEHELRNFIYLQAVLNSFQKKAMNYYAEASSPEERFERLKLIRNTLINTVEPRLSIAPLNAAALESGLGVYPDCPTGQVCRGGVCVDPIEELASWPAHGDPS